jgi:hypothetical protein
MDKNCGKDKQSCEACGWWWINPDGKQCNARFEGCEDASQCCPGMQCYNMIDGDYMGCGMLQDTAEDTCCTFDFKTCDVNWRCSESEDACMGCGGYWRDVTSEPNCIARWTACETDAQCCDELRCVTIDDYKGCGLGEDTHDDSCCSYDFKKCDVGSWCSESADNCKSCKGYWIDPSDIRNDCVPRWDSSCTKDEDCCGWNQMKCMDLIDGYKGCGTNADTHADSCCSWDLQNCGKSDTCNKNKEECDKCVGGYWIDMSDSDGCTRRWKSCENDEQCCNQLKCIQFPDYMGCGLPDVDLPCCSWDMKNCDSGKGADFCSSSKEGCDTCDGFWIEPSKTMYCTARWESCQADKECCPGMRCWPTSDGKKECGTDADTSYDSCCSWNLKVCANDPKCGNTQQGCTDCGGFWIDPSDTTKCTARWEGCVSDKECCGDTKCIQLTGYKGCGYKGVDK